MPTIVRRLLVVCAAALIVVSGSSCSKKTTKPKTTTPPLTQEEADDMVQQMAAAIATDQGGWLAGLQFTLVIMHPPGTAAAAPRATLGRRVLALPASAGPSARVNFDSTFTRAAMNYTYFSYFTDSHGDSLGAWADTVVQVDGTCQATGTITIATPAFSAFYKHTDDPFSATGFEAGSDTINCSGVGDDSLFTTFTPAFRTGTRYFSTTSFVDYSLDMRRDPAVNPFPISGEASAYLFADILRSANTADYVSTLEGTVTFHFDGTATPLVTITNDLENLAPQHSYHVDLRTGTFARVP